MFTSHEKRGDIRLHSFLQSIHLQTFTRHLLYARHYTTSNQNQHGTYPQGTYIWEWETDIFKSHCSIANGKRRGANPTRSCVCVLSDKTFRKKCHLSWGLRRMLEWARYFVRTTAEESCCSHGTHVLPAWLVRELVQNWSCFQHKSPHESCWSWKGEWSLPFNYLNRSKEWTSMHKSPRPSLGWHKIFAFSRVLLENSSYCQGRKLKLSHASGSTGV